MLQFYRLQQPDSILKHALRRRMRKRDVSFGPRTETGKRAWDTFMILAETTRKLGVNFYAYLRDRITAANAIPPLAELIGSAAQKFKLEFADPALSF